MNNVLPLIRFQLSTQFNRNENSWLQLGKNPVAEHDDYEPLFEIN